MTGSVICFGCLQLHSRFAAQVSRDRYAARAIARALVGGSIGQGRATSLPSSERARLSLKSVPVATRCCQVHLRTHWQRAIAGSQLLSPGVVAESGQAGSSARRRPKQGWILMAVAIVNAVSDGIQGRVAGVGGGLCWQCEGKPVPRGGGEQAAVGNQVRYLVHDHRGITSGCT